MVDSVITTDEKKLLTLTKKVIDKIENIDTIIVCMMKKIEKRLFTRMRELDSKAGNSTCATMTGVGGRFNNWCKQEKETSCNQTSIFTIIKPL